MGLFFKKKQKMEKPEVPKYHECPICGELVETKEYLVNNYKQKYLDGQRKVPLSVQLDAFCECKNCGFLHYGDEDSVQYEREQTLSGNNDDLIKLLYSEEYKSIRTMECEDEYYRMLLKLDYINKHISVFYTDIIQFWLNYYTEKQDEQKVQEYLLKKIEEVLRFKPSSGNIKSCELVFDTQSTFRLSDNEILVDLYRRSGQFEKAKELIDYILNNYNFHSKTNPIIKFCSYQLKLMEDDDKSHI